MVDDEPAILELMEMILEDEGYEVFTSVDGAALTAAPPLQPDLILLDLMMPGMDGVRVSQELKANPATTHIPIVLITASNSDYPRLQSVQVEAILHKPFNVDELVKTIRQFIPTETPAITEFTVPTAGSDPVSITAGPGQSPRATLPSRLKGLGNWIIPRADIILQPVIRR